MEKVFPELSLLKKMGDRDFSKTFFFLTFKSYLLNMNYFKGFIYVLVFLFLYASVCLSFIVYRELTCQPKSSLLCRSAVRGQISFPLVATAVLSDRVCNTAQ